MKKSHAVAQLRGVAKHFLPPNENNRGYLVDTHQPQKSIYNVGDYRHNVLTKEEALQSNPKPPQHQANHSCDRNSFMGMGSKVMNQTFSTLYGWPEN